MPITPTWFAQRQLKAEDITPHYVRVNGPNFKETFVGIRKAENGNFEGYVRSEQDGADNFVSRPAFTSEYEAWEAAFELLRDTCIV